MGFPTIVTGDKRICRRGIVIEGPNGIGVNIHVTADGTWYGGSATPVSTLSRRVLACVQRLARHDTRARPNA